jgi:hypothetical protein
MLRHEPGEYLVQPHARVLRRGGQLIDRHIGDGRER